MGSVPMTDDDAIDQEIIDQERAAALAVMADDVLSDLEQAREAEYRAVFEATIRAIADLERQTWTFDRHDD
jgi:hypothetical protein